MARARRGCRPRRLSIARVRVSVGLRLLPRDRAHDGRRRARAARESDAIYLGAIGHPSVPDHVSVWELILPIRQRFEQYVNLRPMRLMPGVTCPLAGRGAADIDMVCVRENSEGEYAGRRRPHASRHAARSGASRRASSRGMGIERVVRYAFGLAASRPRKLLASATKSNALQHSMVLWDEVVGRGRARSSRRHGTGSTTSTRWRREWSRTRRRST